ncbi:hypothetical protein AgCh_017915 [Apium graveolens]
MRCTTSIVVLHRISPRHLGLHLEPPELTFSDQFLVRTLCIRLLKHLTLHPLRVKILIQISLLDKNGIRLDRACSHSRKDARTPEFAGTVLLDAVTVFFKEQSEAGKKLLQRSGRSPDEISSVVLVEEDSMFTLTDSMKEGSSPPSLAADMSTPALTQLSDSTTADIYSAAVIPRTPIASRADSIAALTVTRRA